MNSHVENATKRKSHVLNTGILGSREMVKSPSDTTLYTPALKKMLKLMLQLIKFQIL